MLSVNLHALDVEEDVQGWKRAVVHVLGYFFNLEIASMRRHLHNFFAAATDEMTATMVPNGDTSAEQTKAMMALPAGVAERRSVGSDGTSADGLQ